MSVRDPETAESVSASMRHERGSLGPADAEERTAVPYLSVARAAALAALAIGALSLLGTAYEVRGTHFLSHFDLDAEWNVPAVFSGSLFFVAAAVLVYVRRVFSRPWVAVLFALLLMYMSVDELAEIHERLESWLDVDWQRLYAPLFVVIAITWALLLADLWRDRRARLLFVASGAAWMTSQGLEYFEWDGAVSVPHYTEMMVAEETLEMTGTALLILAILYAGDPVRRARAPFRDRVARDSAST